MKALVIGDTCIDEYRYGIVKRLNPEAPVPLLDLISVEAKKGMAYNVAMNLKAFMLDVDISVPIGNISKKIRYVDNKSGRILMRVDEDLDCVEYEHRDYGPYGFIVISDYNKGYISYDAIKKIRERFDGEIYLDTKKQDLRLFDNTYIKINSLERRKAISLPSPKKLIVTDGASGCFYMGKNYPAFQSEIVDVCGAGDTFLASFAYAHAKTKNIDFALETANRMAAISCGHLGVYALSKEDVECVSF
jgi:bifunctional ADP-heptose synthase (sugar kinase/adenylyltransferase)